MSDHERRAAGHMTEAARERYKLEYYRLLGELTALDAMIHALFPEPGKATDDRLTAEARDLAQRVGALTACWEGQP